MSRTVAAFLRTIVDLRGFVDWLLRRDAPIRPRTIRCPDEACGREYGLSLESNRQHTIICTDCACQFDVFINKKTGTVGINVRP